jgi:hypothetical protein
MGRRCFQILIFPGITVACFASASGEHDFFVAGVYPTGVVDFALWN